MSGDWFPTGIYLNVPTGSADLWTTKIVQVEIREENKKLSGRKR